VRRLANCHHNPLTRGRLISILCPIPPITDIGRRIQLSERLPCAECGGPFHAQYERTILSGPKTLSYITPRNPKATAAATTMIGIAMFHQLGSGTLARSGWLIAKGISHSRPKTQGWLVD
jgi:hypothetical protein